MRRPTGRRSGRSPVRHGLPFLTLALMVAAFVIVPAASDRSISHANLYDISQQVASLGTLVLALGLTMIAGEFDLSVPATYQLGSMVAVTTGVGSPAAGVVAGVAAGAAAGVVQGLVVTRLRVNSMCVTLGGYLGIVGLVFVVGHSSGVGYPRFDVGARLEQPLVEGVISLRSLVVIGCFLAVAAVFTLTRLGPEVRATGSDRRAARVAGIEVERLLVGVFAASGALAALGGALQGYALAVATPSTATDSLIFAATAALLGGVSLRGGEGTVAGIAAGTLTLGVLAELLAVMAFGDYITSLVTGALLVVVALAGAPDLSDRLVELLHPLRASYRLRGRPVGADDR